MQYGPVGDIEYEGDGTEVLVWCVGQDPLKILNSNDDYTKKLQEVMAF